MIGETIKRIVQNIANQERRATALIDHFRDNQEVREESQRKQLIQSQNTISVVLSIFSPLSFITGVYGMNFTNIPELSWQYGYTFFWGIATVTTMVTLGDHHSRGFFPLCLFFMYFRYIPLPHLKNLLPPLIVISLTVSYNSCCYHHIPSPICFTSISSTMGPRHLASSFSVVISLHQNDQTNRRQSHYAPFDTPIKQHIDPSQNHPHTSEKDLTWGRGLF